MNLVVIADEVAAAGWQLIGARIHRPDKGNLEHCLHAALSEADLVLISAREAAKLPAAQRDAALRADKPLLLVIADSDSTVAPPDLEQEVLRALGVSR